MRLTRSSRHLAGISARAIPVCGALDNRGRSYPDVGLEVRARPLVAPQWSGLGLRKSYESLRSG